MPGPTWTGARQRVAQTFGVALHELRALLERKDVASSHRAAGGDISKCVLAQRGGKHIIMGSDGMNIATPTRGGPPWERAGVLCVCFRMAA